MLTTIKGYYEEGRIVLEEEPLQKTKTDVIVTFLNGNNITKNTKRILGQLAGKIITSDNFNDPIDDFEEA